MIRSVAIFILIISAAAAGAGDGVSSETTGCVARLEQTLAAMQSRPLLKEEHATALMWLRMDAAEAAAAGDDEGCLAKTTVIEDLLGISTDPE